MDTVQIIVQEQHRETVQIIVQEVAGPAGLDNYRIAVVNGYEGTVQEYLASMKGNPFIYADFTPEQLLALKGAAFSYADFTPEQLLALRVFVDPVVIAQELVYAESIAVDFADSANATVTLTGDAAVELANVPDGAKGAIYVTQDEVGTRLITGITHEGLTAKVKGGALTLSVAAGAIDKLEFERVGSTLFVSVISGF